MTETTDKPNPADFSTCDRGEYTVVIRVEGTMQTVVKAASQEEADNLAFELADLIAEGAEPVELGDADEVSVVRVSRRKPMYRVTRDGAKMQVTHLEPGDLPREPDETGF